MSTPEEAARAFTRARYQREQEAQEREKEKERARAVMNAPRRVTNAIDKDNIAHQRPQRGGDSCTSCRTHATDPERLKGAWLGDPAP
jgi:hypothetical protein